MKVAIWAAVSTVSQAGPDKVSLQTQVEKGREFVASHKFKLAGEYIVPGESRTAFISLSHAEQEIPELKRLLNDAERGSIDIVWMYDLNRLRNLMLQVFEGLTGYGVQIYNHDDPDTPIPRHLYTPEVINARRLKVKLHDIISGQEINTLQKHFREKMPKRVTEKRLHPGLGLPPYGYRKPPSLQHDRNAVLEIVPEEARVLLEMKDWFLRDGLSLTAITERLNERGTLSPRGKRWWFSIVRYLLANPFYYGVVTYGATKRQRDRRMLTIKRTKGEAVTAEGLHKPLWSKAVHQRIVDELERRANAQPGTSMRAFTRLLYCECGAVLWAQKTPAGKYWRCSTLKKGHTYINDKTAHDIIIPKLVHAIEHAESIKLPSLQDDTPMLEKEIRDLKAKQTRLLDIYEDGEIDKMTLNKRMEDIKTRLDRAQGLLIQTGQTASRRQSLRENLAALRSDVGKLDAYIRNAPPARVNAALHTVLKGVKISKKEHQVELMWRL